MESKAFGLASFHFLPFKTCGNIPKTSEQLALSKSTVLMLLTLQKNSIPLPKQPWSFPNGVAVFGVVMFSCRNYSFNDILRREVNHSLRLSVVVPFPFSFQFSAFKCLKTRRGLSYGPGVHTVMAFSIYT